MKHILTALCALTLLMAGCTPALAAEAPASALSPEPERNCFYPISVEEYTYGPLDELRISKVYQLSLSDDPSLIPSGDFERGGRHFYLLDMTRKDEVGVDTHRGKLGNHRSEAAACGCSPLSLSALSKAPKVHRPAGAVRPLSVCAGQN